MKLAVIEDVTAHESGSLSGRECLIEDSPGDINHIQCDLPQFRRAMDYNVM
jgi:hypothetical protein